VLICGKKNAGVSTRISAPDIHYSIFFPYLSLPKQLMEEESLSLFDLDLQIDDAAGTYLKDTTKWTRIISIIFIVFASILLLCILAMLGFRAQIVDSYDRNGTALAFGTSGDVIFLILMLVFLLVIGMIIVFIYLLLRFSKLTKRGIDGNDLASLESGIASLKNYMIITGVFTSLSVLSGLFQFFKLLG
jgi:hypothetical protein